MKLYRRPQVWAKEIAIGQRLADIFYKRPDYRLYSLCYNNSAIVAWKQPQTTQKQIDRIISKTKNKKQNQNTKTDSVLDWVSGLHSLLIPDAERAPTGSNTKFNLHNRRHFYPGILFLTFPFTLENSIEIFLQLEAYRKDLYATIIIKFILKFFVS